MINGDRLLIVIDAGHGGWDNGASFEGRLEKDDNLRLALEVQKQLELRGVPVLMTRDTDVYVTLADRVAMANAAGADLFVSLHRNSYIMHTPSSNGVENFIYLTAPDETSGKAAQLVLDRVVDVGVQSNRGVQRGNYYVLRRSIMPSMLLEMGFIIDDIDNALFDEHFYEYAQAIAKGVMQYFGLPFEAQPEIPAVPDEGVAQVQRAVNERLALDMPISGVFDNATRSAMIMALQTALNRDYGARLIVDGILGPQTLAAFQNVYEGQRGNVVFVMQALLRLNGYNPGELDGDFGLMTKTALLMFQRDNELHADAIVGRVTLKALLGI